MNSSSPMTRFLVWRLKHISNKNFVLILSAIIGCIAGLSAVSLKWCTHKLHHALTHNFSEGTENYYYIAFPLIGLVITVLLAKYVFGEKLGHGVATILWYISKGSSMMKKRILISRWITSVFTVGFGGSVGLEAPIVTTGAAVGSNIGKSMHMHYKKRTLLIGCGVAAAISAIFNAPIAGVIFAMEIILAETTISNFVPLIIASASGKVVTMLLVQGSTVFEWHNIDPFTASDVLYFIGLGVFCGLMALYFTISQYFVEDTIEKIPNDIIRAIVGGLGLGVIIFFFPPIYGEGYNVVTTLLTGDSQALLDTSLFKNVVSPQFLIGFIALMVLFKAVASALTIGAGGSGGIFAPSLFVGGVSGFLFSTVVNSLGGDISIRNFTLVGMCGLMSGIQHAPLSAIFLIAEMTGGYVLFIPLMIVSAISYLTKSFFEPHSIYTKRLIEKGDLITSENKDKQVLSLLDMKKLIEKDFQTVDSEATLGQMVELIKESPRNIFPVIDNDGKLLGILRLDDIRKIMFDKDMYDRLYVKTLMQRPRETVLQDESMTTVMGKFESTGLWNMAVVDENYKYIGVISKSQIFNSYRKRLIRQHKD